MGAAKDLIEDWIAVRSMLVRQLEILRSGEMRTGLDVYEVSMETTITRVETCVRELNTLLKEFARLQDR